MAGRPATVRGSGLTGLHYGLIAFVIIAVAAMGLFIFQLTKVKEAQAGRESAERQPRPRGSAVRSRRHLL